MPKKNPHAAALGRLGGKARAEKLTAKQISKIASKAGKVRSKKLSPEERSRIAALGAKARWQKREMK
jgi:hypothetical protein